METNSPLPPDRAMLSAEFRSQFGIEDIPLDDFDHALTHRSFTFEQNLNRDNERLEFLGDAILSSVVAAELYRRFPTEQEGELSKRRGNLVSRSMLGLRASEMGLGPLLLLGIGEERTGGTRRRSVLGSALEALIGVVYIHGGHDRARKFILEHVLDPILERTQTDTLQGDFKTALQELTHKHFSVLPRYRRVEETGPDHDKKFTVEVEVAGRSLGQASGSRVKTAENEAARIGLEVLQREING